MPCDVDSLNKSNTKRIMTNQNLLGQISFLNCLRRLLSRTGSANLHISIECCCRIFPSRSLVSWPTHLCTSSLCYPGTPPAPSPRYCIRWISSLNCFGFSDETQRICLNPLCQRRSLCPHSFGFYLVPHRQEQVLWVGMSPMRPDRRLLSEQALNLAMASPSAQTSVGSVPCFVRYSSLCFFGSIFSSISRSRS